MNTRKVLANTKENLLDRSNEEKLILTGLSILATVGLCVAVSKGWDMYREKKQPEQNHLFDAELREETLWTVGTSVAVGLCGLLVRRALARVSGLHL